MNCVYCEVQTEILYRILVKYVLQDVKGFEKNSVTFKKKTKQKFFMAKGDFLKMTHMHFFLFCSLCRYFMDTNWTFFEHPRLYFSKFHVWLHFLQTGLPLLISNFRHVLNVVLFLLVDSPASEFYVSPSRTICLFRNVGT